MNVDRIFETMNRQGVRFLLIGGMNFMLRHEPILTYDVDLWIEDVESNLLRCEAALADLDAEWGANDNTWEPVAKLTPGWLARQALYCLTTPHAAIDVFRRVLGLDDWQACFDRAVVSTTTQGNVYRALSDIDMLQCQLALDAGLQKQERIRVLRAALDADRKHS